MSEQVVEQAVAQLLAERLDVHQAVHRDGRVDDLAHLAVTRLGDLVDELLFVGHDHAGLAEARLEEVHVLRGREHVRVAGQVPRARWGCASPGTPARNSSSPGESPGALSGSNVVMLASLHHSRAVLVTVGDSRMTAPLQGLRTVIHPVADLAAAKAWCTDLLGYGPYFDEPFYVGFEVGGYELGLLPDADPADGALVYWGVADVDRGGRRRGGPRCDRPLRRPEVGDGIVTATVTTPQGSSSGSSQPALRRELTKRALARGGRPTRRRCRRGRELQRWLAELEDHSGMLDADLGEVVGPEAERVAVGHREREVVERLGGASPSATAFGATARSRSTM